MIISLRNLIPEYEKSSTVIEDAPLKIPPKVVEPSSDIQPLLPAADTTATTRLPGLNEDSLFGLNERLLYIANITGNILYVVDPQMSKVVQTVKIASLKNVIFC